MSTRSTIGRLNEDGSVTAVYCHSDGYPSHNGAMLTHQYANQESVDKIMELGDLSFLDESLDKPDGHSFENSVDGYSIFYGRDRGEDHITARTYNDKKDWLDRGMDSTGAEYAYLWNGTSWEAFDCDGEILDLAKAIEED